MISIELGLPEQKIYSNEELSIRTKSEPNYQFAECIENLFHHAGYYYIDNPSLRTDDVLLARFDGALIGFLRLLCFDDVGDLTLYLKKYNLYKLFVYSPREKDVSGRVKSLGPMTYGYNLSYQEDRNDNLFDINWNLYNYSTQAFNYMGEGPVLTHLSRNLSFRGFNSRELLQEKIRELKIEYDSTITSPVKFLERCTRSKVCVFAPGVSNTGLDRSPIMAMSVGACVIHPEIKAVLPLGQLIPGVHYLKCKDDFSDLEELINTPLNTRLQIGQNAKVFFKRYLTPTPLVNYILENT